jgi:hypothetical protein
MRKDSGAFGGVGLYDPMKSPSYSKAVTPERDGLRLNNTYPAPPE